MNFGERLRQLRAERNLTQPQLAQLIGIEQSYLSKLENDKSIPSADIFQAILRALGVNVASFLQGVDEKQVYRDLRQVPEVSSHLNAQVTAKIHSIKTWLFASGIALTLGFTLFVAGMRGLIFPDVRFNYASAGLLGKDEPADLFDVYVGLNFAYRQAGGMSEKEANERALDITRRRLPAFRLLDDYRGKAFTEEVPGGQRTWFFQRAEQFERPENRWLMLAGLLFAFGGLAGFIVEARLHRVRL